MLDIYKEKYYVEVPKEVQEKLLTLRKLPMKKYHLIDDIVKDVIHLEKHIFFEKHSGIDLSAKVKKYQTVSKKMKQGRILKINSSILGRYANRVKDIFDKNSTAPTKWHKYVLVNNFYKIIKHILKNNKPESQEFIKRYNAPCYRCGLPKLGLQDIECVCNICKHISLITKSSNKYIRNPMQDKPLSHVYDDDMLGEVYKDSYKYFKDNNLTLYNFRKTTDADITEFIRRIPRLIMDKKYVWYYFSTYKSRPIIKGIKEKRTRVPNDIYFTIHKAFLDYSAVNIIKVIASLWSMNLDIPIQKKTKMVGRISNRL